MPKSYRSTTLRLFSHACPAALALQDAGAPEDRSVFGAGICAHAMLQAVGMMAVMLDRDLGGNPENDAEADIIDTTIDVASRQLLRGERYFDGVKEPPYSPEDVATGETLAKQWLMVYPVAAEAEYEIGLGMTAAGEPAGYNEVGTRYSALIDVLIDTKIGDEEDGELSAVIIEDYKSAWSTDESELDTLQLRGQAVLAGLHYPNADLIVQRAHNLRTFKTYQRMIYRNTPGGKEDLHNWRRQIFNTCDAADVTRTARPGYQCGECRYNAPCEHAFRPVQDGTDDPVTQFILAKARAKAMLPVVQPMVKHKPVTTAAGTLGYEPERRREPVEGIEWQLSMAWHNHDREDAPRFRAQHECYLGLLKALKITAGQVANVAKVLHPGKASAELREEFIDDLTVQVVNKKLTPKAKINDD